MMSKTEIKNEKVGIIGSGLIGRSWAMLFASGGYNVTIYDILPEQVTSALSDILLQLKELEKTGLIRGSLSAEEQHNLIVGTNDFAECVKGSKHVQECVPENLDLKRTIFKKLDELADDNVVLSSSTSCIVPSDFTSDLKHRSQCIVSHPTNPPFYCPLTEVVCNQWTDPAVVTRTRSLLEEIGQVPVMVKKEIFGFALNRMQYALFSECWRLVKINPPTLVTLVELIPAPWTDPTVVSRTRKIMEEIGQTPVAMKKEMPGFAVNRVQYAALNECYRLVQGGVISVEDIDKVMSEGLGMRYAFLGPLETTHLNAEGFQSYLDRYGETIYNVSESFGPTPKMGGAAAEQIHKELCEKVPIEKLQERRKWRDARLAALAKVKKDMAAKE